MKISAIIFDLDGTLIASRNQWGKAFTEVLRGLGKNITDGYPDTPGISIENNWRALLTKYQITTDKTLDELKTLTYRYYVKMLPEVTLREGAEKFLNDLRQSGTKIALATSCEWWVVQAVFEKLGLDGMFDITVTGEETVNKKPFPDAFLLATDKLGVLPGDCLVIGDTPSDIEAARGAGAKVIVVVKGEPAKELKKADLVVEDFSEITPEVIAQL